MIEDLIRRIVLRLFPDLKAGLHLPQWGRITKIHTVENGHESTQLEPGYCVDIELLNAVGRERVNYPTFEKIPLPATGAGNQRGIFANPSVGSLVELGFILGHQDKPFIRTILIQENNLPSLNDDEVLLSRDADNFIRLNSSNGITENCTAKASRTAGQQQNVIAPVIWIGSDAINLVDQISKLSAQVQSLSTALANHNHRVGNSTTEAPNTANNITNVGTAAGQIKSTVDAVKASSI